MKSKKKLQKTYVTNVHETNKVSMHIHEWFAKREYVMFDAIGVSEPKKKLLNLMLG